MQNAHKYYVSFSQLKKKKKAKRSEAESDPPLYGRHWVEVQIFLFLIIKICEKRVQILIGGILFTLGFAQF